METRREFAKEMAKKLNWVDIVKDPKMLTVDLIWKLYSQQIFQGVSVSAIQYQETKQAFYCGFAEAFKMVTDISVNLSEDQACGCLSRLAAESNEFIDSLIDRTLK